MTLTTEQLTTQIMSGEWDGNLGDISKAVGYRLQTGPGAFMWRVDYTADDVSVTVTEEDLTVREAELIEKAASVNWSQIIPYQSAHCAKAVLTTVLVTRCAMSNKRAVELVDAMSALALTRCVEMYEVVSAPLESAASSS